MLPSQKKLVAKTEDKSCSKKNESKILMSMAKIQKEEQNEPMKMCAESELSPHAKEWITKLNEAL
jgi:hypothetical protein